ncbi:hypothetical protein PORY_000389 [Pneumocystis oryctolagi]|uniref:Uncharacterized protein n=1 Tax=Pneumocystis oryctolagi TaxID=42067 RepID=A0ACB7CFN5_9ASCO|nr:hypothetical protein PORY_000389 [Pneumocystis oryctolagi]
MSELTNQSHVSQMLSEQLEALKKELDEGEITQKGYEKRKKQLLLKYGEVSESTDKYINTNSQLFQGNENSGGNQNYISKGIKTSLHMKSKDGQSHNHVYSNPYRYRSGTLSYDQVSHISEEKYSAFWAEQAGKQQLPFKPRGIPFSVFDQYNPSILMTRFNDIASVLRYRSKNSPKKKALIVVNGMKEVGKITYNKLASRAEKIALMIKGKHELHQGDRVVLIYENSEIVEFAVSLFACFIAGVIAVPINNYDNFDELNEILISTQSHIILTTNANLKRFQKDLINKKFRLPPNIELWRTDNIGGYQPKKNEDTPPLRTDDLAYIEYSHSPIGEVRGVVVSHRTIMNQMTCLNSIVSTVPKNTKKNNNSKKNSSKKNTSTKNDQTIITYLDSRQTIGLIFNILFSIYNGDTTIWCPRQSILVPGLWATLITKYKATIILADYPGLKTVTFNYQDDPMTTRKFAKKYPIDFSSIRLCLINCISVDSEFHEIFADRWLKPLGNSGGHDIISPMLCLPEHGGMVISTRDWLGREEQMFLDSSNSFNIPTKNELTQVLLNKEALKTNKIVVVAENDSEKDSEKDSENLENPDSIKFGSFWYPLVDTTIAIVDPERLTFCSPNVVGEIWVDSPSLSGGFWDLPHDTDAIFHAKAYVIDTETLKPVAFDQEFLRTGLLGCIIDGRILVLGLYEDRLRQRIDWTENGQDLVEYGYHYVSHLVQTIMRKVPHVFDCSLFDISINNEYLPVVVLELPSSLIPIDSLKHSGTSNNLLLDSVSEKCKESLLEMHDINVYCVMITSSNTLPRLTKNGHKEISNMLCRKEFELGTLPCEYIKFSVKKVILNLPVGEDPVGGIWSKEATEKRQELLLSEKKQHSVRDERTLSIDDRTLINLLDFRSIVDILQWRVTCQGNEVALCIISSKAKENKKITWKNLDLRIADIANYLKFKMKLQSGDHAILMCAHPEELLYTIHACFCLGIVAIPIPAFDPSRLSEDVPSILGVVSDFKIKAILVDSDTYCLFKSKAISFNIKHYSSTMKIVLPNIINISKSPKQTQGCVDLGFILDQDWINSGVPALVWIYWSPDQRYTAVELGHDTIMSCCKVQKETCQMSSSYPVLGCIHGASGIGFIHSYVLGFFMGAITYLISPKDFTNNPMILFRSIAKYKVKDTYIPPEALEYAMAATQAKGICLHELKNLMIPFNSRPKVDYSQRLKNHISTSILSPSSVNNIYSCALNPMVTTRSYMSIEPVHLYLNIKSLRHGIIETVDITQDPLALLLYDSGMVTVSTHIAIVNPETCDLCSVGEFGEIWVSSDANMKSFYGSKDKTDIERFQGILAKNDQSDVYVRTGDLGFLYNIQRPLGPEGLLIEVQSLFVLGSIGDTFEIDGLLYFPIDIETSIERCHRSIVPGGSAIFQAGGSVIILIEVDHKAHLPSIVPVVVNTVLSEHQIIADVIVFTAKGNFPRSRIGEKQRGKILSSWLTKKMEILDKFIIREQEINVSRTFDT